MYKRAVETILLCTVAILYAANAGADSTSAHHLVVDQGEYAEARDRVHTHVFKESMPHLSFRDDLLKKGRSEHDHIHEVMFAVQPRNMDELTRILHDVSDPYSENYGKHLKKEEMHNLISNPEACAEVTSYLHASGAISLTETPNGEYISASAPIAVWEKFFNTEFFVFQQTHLNGVTHEVVRAEHYSVPIEIHRHVNAVLNTVEMPVLTHLRPKNIPNDLKLSRDRKLVDQVVPGMIDPNWLRQYYNMSDSHGSSLSTQAVFSIGNYFFSQDDLADFQEYVTLQKTQPAISIGNHSTTDRVNDDCAEGNLDLQYIMTLSPISPTTFWHVDTSIGEWLRTVASAKNIPLVLSISFGSYEYQTTKGELDLFQAMAIRLGSIGVTVLAAAGDDGAAAKDVSTWTECRYLAMFPASCPYIVSVGATMVIIHT